MATVGSNIGSTFTFDPYQTPEQSPYGGIPSTAQDDVFMDKDVGSLEQIEGLTSDYFSGVANLKNMQRMAMKRYGVDLTNPDLADPSQQEMFNLFLKQYARVKDLGNALKTGRENQLLEAKFRATDPDFMSQGRTGEYDTTGLDFQSGKVRDWVSEARANVNRRFDNYSQYQQALQEKENVLSDLQSELAEAEDDNTRQAIQNQINNVNTWTPDYARFRQYVPSASETKEKEARKTAKEVNDLYQGLVKGTKESIDRLKSAENIINVVYEYSGADSKIPVARVTTAKGEDILIDLSNPNEGLRATGNVAQQYLKEFSKLDQDALSPQEVDMSFREDHYERQGKYVDAATYLFKNLGRPKNYESQAPELGWKEGGNKISGADDVRKLANRVTEIATNNNGLSVRMPNGYIEKVLSITPDYSFFDRLGTVLKVKLSDDKRPEGRTVSYGMDSPEGQSFVSALFEQNPDVAKVITQDRLSEDEKKRENESTTYTETQMKAVDAFKKQVGREPTPTELGKILAKYK